MKQQSRIKQKNFPSFAAFNQLFLVEALSESILFLS